ncbi:CDP-diacylglycerol--glycerol-3-phosphate 3-phosphatidyltransferase [Symplocastrum sp. BBK-W-15]|uniref:CDP-diacylglycerol--glycerol-3-phosphate 3-phosphatidyltransferase n=2 Tax=Limnofasciculus TaxID=3064905 RepID=A0AAE3KL71_9CYAN|nr:CDP-diacylglycerol--glycerol-3-phosphate 3-phosphatidyltransferase [Limnofasciculus baicalensis BBK-W-15]
MSNTAEILPKHQHPLLTLHSIPAALVALRFLIAPLLLLEAFYGFGRVWFMTGFAIAFLSDIFDGVIDRRLGVSTASLRRADSWADVCLYLCVSAAAWRLYPDEIMACWLPLSLVVALQGVWWVVNLLKYGQPASYHTYSAKLWGLILFVATIALFGFDYGGITLMLVGIVGIVHTVEEIAMTLILPTWTHDVLSIVHALQLRREFRNLLVYLDK